MAIPKIKATYSLDAETVKRLERLARRWETSKSEALRRLIKQGDATSPEDASTKIAALKRLQKSLGLTEASANAWVRESRAVRRAGSKHRGF